MNKQVLIIAEAGVNHNGRIDIAMKLIDAAKEAGADIVKFQTFKSEKLVTRTAQKAAYQKKTTGSNESQFEMLKKLELSEKDHYLLVNYCKKKNIKFLSTPFDLDSIDLLSSLKMDIFKIPSGELNNLPYIKKIGGLNKKIIMSTGMSTMKEVQDNLKILLKAGAKRKNIIVLHCHSEYPTPMQDVNLNAMLTMRKILGVQVGYSDHTVGIEIPIAAVALGATVIEKHFTLDKLMDGPDHKASLNPDELKAMVTAIRNIEKALGDGVKRPTARELQNKKVAQKSIHISQALPKGTMLQENHLTMKRPSGGISPMKMNLVLGRRLLKNVEEDYRLKLSDIK